MERGFDTMAGHLTDIKDMVIDQNEWYEEMFYDGDNCSNPSEYFDTNQVLHTNSDVSYKNNGTSSGVGSNN
jgi:hypothetical protein